MQIFARKCIVFWRNLHSWHKFYMATGIPYICHFFTQANFLENKIYTEIYTVIANLHSKLPIFALNLKKFTPAKINLHGRRPWRLWQIWGMCTCSHELTQAYVHTDKTAHLVFAHNAQSHGQQRILLLPTQSLQANTGSYKHICSHRQDCPPSPCTSYKCIPAMQVLQSLHVCSHRQHYPPNPCTKIPIERRSCTYH